MDAKLQVCSGCIGQPRLVEGKTSEHIAAATVKAVKLFCTPGFAGSFDSGLFKHIRQTVHIMVTDAASSEILASDMLRKRRGSGHNNLQRDPFFPNLLLLGRDASHACMRLIKRPWHVMDEVKDVVSSTITHKDSVAQKIFHSPNYSFWLQEAIDRGSGPQTSSLSAAKHRFASFAKPMGRFILNLQPMFEVLHKILALKEDCGWLHTWMDAVSGQRLLLLAAAADAADTVMEFLRLMDNEEQDPAILNSEVHSFLSNVDVQFGTPGQVFEINGYSKHCLDVLQSEPGLYVKHRGQQKRLRVSAADRRAVLQAFKPWVHLCHEACEAEFPHFHLFSSMGVLDLRSDARRTNERYSCLRRLAAALHVDEQGLVSEFETLRPVAMAFRQQQDCSSRDAWKQALKRSQASSALKEKYETKNLAPLLRAHACWTTSSSGVEQAFSKAQRSQGAKHFGSKAAESERRAMVSLTYTDSSATPLALVVDKARELYASKVSRHLGQHKGKRFDKGVKRGPRTKLAGKLVEKTWINRRRASVKAAAAQSSASGQKPVDDAAIANLSVKAQKDRATGAGTCFIIISGHLTLSFFILLKFFRTVCFQSFVLLVIQP